MPLILSFEHSTVYPRSQGLFCSRCSAPVAPENSPQPARVDPMSYSGTPYRLPVQGADYSHGAGERSLPAVAPRSSQGSKDRVREHRSEGALDQGGRSLPASERCRPPVSWLARHQGPLRCARPGWAKGKGPIRGRMENLTSPQPPRPPRCHTAPVSGHRRVARGPLRPKTEGLPNWTPGPIQKPAGHV